jgi:hypothetical protein
VTAPARRLSILAACALALPCLFTAPVAVDAAKPKSVKPKAGDYVGFGRVTRNPKGISFRVPSSRKSMQEVRFPACSENGGHVVSGAPPMTAKVSKKGKIKGTASLRSRVEFEIGPYEEIRDWTLKINGRFKQAHRAKGRLSITVRYFKVHKGTETPVAGGGDATCNTGSVTWGAKRQ